MKLVIILLVISGILVGFSFLGAFKLEEKERGTGYQCFHCLHYTVRWDSDFDFSDFDYEGEGVVHVCHCSNCGAEIEYKCGE